MKLVMVWRQRFFFLKTFARIYILRLNPLAQTPMPVPPRRFLRELNVAAALLLLVVGIVCGVYTSDRGTVQLSFTVNNSNVKTAPHVFSVGTVYAAMLGFSAAHHVMLAKWPGRTLRYLRRGVHTDRWLAFAVVLPTTSVATVVGIAGVTDIFAVYAAVSIAVVLLFGLWLATQHEVWAATRAVVALAAIALFLTFWLFVWAQTVRFTTPLLMYSMGTVIMLVASVIMWHTIHRAITREAILVNVSVGLQLGCAGIWAALHRSAAAASAPLAVFMTVVAIFAAMCLFAVFRINGTLFDAVNDAEIDSELEEELLPQEGVRNADDDVFGPSQTVASILNGNDDDSDSDSGSGSGSGLAENAEVSLTTL